nr:MAG TPA: Terminase large subunit [Crassvirales sp.]
MEKIEFNKCQTPLEDLHLESYPKEVQEQWWDFLNNVPFIKWMVSKDRPLVSELPRDDEGKVKIDVTKPPILEHTEYFSRTARVWEKTGMYNSLRPNRNPNSDYGKWIREERRRGWEGLIDPSTGMWVTGDYYWMLNYCPMHLVEKKSNGMSIRVVKHPKFWDGQFLVSHYFNQARVEGHHAIELASRGRGKTSFGAAMLAKRFILGESNDNKEGIQCLVTAADRTKLIGTNQILSVFIDDIDFSAKETQFERARLRSSVQELSWQMGYKLTGSDVKYGSKNEVTGIISGVNQDKLNGSRGVLYLIEEAGIFKNLLDVYNMIRPSVEQGNSVFGEIISYGTAGNDESDFTSFYEMFSSPEGYNIKPLANVFDKEGQGRKEASMFYGAYMNYDDSCIDKDGNSDVTKALLNLCNDRYKVKYGSTDINTITKRISQYPITPQEAIIRSTGNMFPVTELTERLNQIDNNPSEYDDTYVGEFVINPQGEIEFKPSVDKPIREFPLKDNKVKGALEIYEMPQRDGTGKIPNGRYITAVDPYDSDQSETMSLGSFFVLDLWTDRIVAEYTGRPQFADDFYEITRRGTMFYDAKCMYENNLRGLFAYYSKCNSVYLLAETPQYLRDRQLIGSTGFGNSAYGIRATPPIINYGFRLIRDWLMKSSTKIEKNDKGEDVEVTVPNLYNIRNRALLKELMLWNPVKNFDRVMSLVQLMLYREEKMILYQGNIQRGEERKDGMENDDYFTKNYPGKMSERINLYNRFR